MNCVRCGAEIPPQERPGRPRVKCEACSPSRPRRKWKPEQASAAPPAPPVAVLALAEAVAEGPGRNEAAVRAQLGAVGRLDSIAGAAALDAAIALDSPRIGAVGRATLLKEMRTAAAEALKGAAPAGRLVDELRAQRARRSG